MSFRRVLIATLLNPKAVVFAFVIVPHLAEAAPARAAPYLGALAGLIALAGGSWIALGAAIGGGASLPSGLARRAGAFVLCLFAVLVGSSAFTA